MITIYLNGKEYAQVESMWYADAVLREMCEEYENLEYTDPECGCIYAETGEERSEEIETEDDFDQDLFNTISKQRCTERMAKLLNSWEQEQRDLLIYGESVVKTLWDTQNTPVHCSSFVVSPDDLWKYEVGNFHIGSDGTKYKVTAIDRSICAVYTEVVAQQKSAQDLGSNLTLETLEKGGLYALKLEDGKYVQVMYRGAQLDVYSGTVCLFSGESTLYCIRADEVSTAIRYLSPQGNNTQSGCSEHDYVNVSFMGIKMECKYCGKAQEGSGINVGK